MRRLLLAAVVLVLLACAAPALAAGPPALCIPNETEKTVLSTSEAALYKCKAGYTLEFARTGAESEHMKYNAEGVAKRPTWEINGANIAVKRGTGGLGSGDIVVGENPLKAGETVGDDNVVIGQENVAGSGESLVVGNKNISSSFWTVVTGEKNSATGLAAVVIGGKLDKAKGELSSICGLSEKETTELLQNLC